MNNNFLAAARKELSTMGLKGDCRRQGRGVKARPAGEWGHGADFWLHCRGGRLDSAERERAGGYKKLTKIPKWAGQSQKIGTRYFFKQQQDSSELIYDTKEICYRTKQVNQYRELTRERSSWFSLQNATDGVNGSEMNKQQDKDQERRYYRDNSRTSGPTQCTDESSKINMYCTCC